MKHLTRTFIFLVLLSFPSGVYACACCGVDDTWYEHDFSFEDYDYIEFDKLQFSGGYFSNPGYEENYEVVEVVFSKEKLELIGPNFKAVLLLEDKGTQSRQDITFVVRPESPMTDEAVIFHEVVIEGEITLQVTGSSEAKHPAKLIMQGLGNACLSENDFKKWMIKIEGNDLAGSGKLTFGAPTATESEAKE